MNLQKHSVKKNYAFFLKTINQFQDPHELAEDFYLTRTNGIVKIIPVEKYELKNDSKTWSSITKNDEEDSFSHAQFYLVNPIASTEQLDSPLYLLSGAIEDGFHVLEGKISLFNLDILQEDSHNIFSCSFICKKIEQNKPSFMVNFHGEDIFIWMIQ